MSTGLTAHAASEYFGTICVAMVTPFDGEGRLDLAAGQRLAQHLVEHGVDALVLAGTTGETPTTTKQEKLDFLAAIRSAVGNNVKLIAGAGTNNTQASVDMARASAQAGADALLVVTPYYSKPSQEGVYQHFRAVAQATDLPVCLYDIPPRSVIPISSDVIARLAEIPNVLAMKDAKGDFATATTLIRDTGLAWYSGDDPLTLPWLSLGAVGVVSVIGHLAPQQLRDMHTAWMAGDLERAREINASLTPLMQAQGRLGGVAMAKAGLRLQGIEVGDPRLPILAPQDDELDRLQTDMKQAGVL